MITDSFGITHAIASRVAPVLLLSLGWGHQGSASEVRFDLKITSSEGKTCVAEQPNPSLLLNDDITRDSQRASTQDLHAFFRSAGEMLPSSAPGGTNNRWMREHSSIERVLQEPSLLDMVYLPDESGKVAVLRPANTAATCGSGGCSTPVIINVGCGEETALECLAAGLEDYRTHAMLADSLRFIANEDDVFVQIDNCHCQGIQYCYKSTSIWKLDFQIRIPVLEAHATWHLDTDILSLD